MVDPLVLSLIPSMVLLNNAHYPNAILPARITDHIHDFFNVIDQVVQDVQDTSDEEEGNDPEGGNEGGQEEEAEGAGQEDQASYSSDAESESLDLDQQENIGQDSNPVDEVMQQVEEAEQAYNPGSPAQDVEEG